MTDLKRTIETYTEFTGEDGNKFKLNISDNSIIVRVMARVGADGEQLSLNHADFAVIVSEVAAWKRSVFAASATALAAK
jgi:hypothetical protein